MSKTPWHRVHHPRLVLLSKQCISSNNASLLTRFQPLTSRRVWHWLVEVRTQNLAHNCKFKMNWDAEQWLWFKVAPILPLSPNQITKLRAATESLVIDLSPSRNYKCCTKACTCPTFWSQLMSRNRIGLRCLASWVELNSVVDLKLPRTRWDWVTWKSRFRLILKMKTMKRILRFQTTFQASVNYFHKMTKSSLWSIFLHLNRSSIEWEHIYYVYQDFLF